MSILMKLASIILREDGKSMDCIIWGKEPGGYFTVRRALEKLGPLQQDDG